MDAGSVIIRLVADAKGVVSGVSQGTGAIQGYAANAKRVGASMMKVGKSMTKWVTVPILAAGVAAGKWALDFNKSMTNVEALVGMSATQVAKFKEQILQLAPAVGRSPKELGEAFYFIASSGLKGAAAMRALKASALASAAGLGDTKVIADAVTSAINAYGESTLSATKATDILLAAVREGKSEPTEFAGSIGRVIPMAAKMGVSFGEVAGTMAAMSLNGTNANEAVTQISSVLSAAIKPTKQGSEALKTIGMDYEGLRKSIADKGLLPTFEKLNRAYKGNVESLGAVFGNVRALRGVLTLTGASAVKYKKIIEDVSRAQGDTAKAAAIALAKPGAKMQQAWAGVQSAMIKVGDIIVPVFAKIAEKVAGVAKAFSNLPKGTQVAIVEFAALAAVSGPVLAVFGKLASLSVSVAAGVGRVAFAAQAAAGGAATLGESLVMALGPTGLTVAAILAAGGLVYGLYRIDKALSNTIANAEDYKNVMAAVKGPNAGALQAAADKALGGHYVVKSGTLVWQPKNVDVSSETIVKAVHTAAAKLRAAKAEEAKQDLISEARLRAQELADKAQTAQMAASAAGDPRSMVSKAGQAAMQAQADFAKSQAEQAIANVRKLGGALTDLQSKNKTIIVKAQITDLQNGVKTAGQVLKALTKKPQTAKIILAEGKVREQIARMKAGIEGITRKNWKVLVEAKIQTAQGGLAKLKAALSSLNKQKTSPKIEAQKKTLEAAIAKAKASLKSLNAQKTSPKLGVQDNASGPVRTLKALLDSLPASKTITLTTVTNTVKHALGGVFTTPHVGMVAEDGPEAIIPLSKPARAAQVMAQAGLSAARSATGTATKVASTVAAAIGKGLGGLKGKRAKKLTSAADVSGAIGTLVEFISSITTALESLSTMTVPQLAPKWQAKVKKIVSMAARISVIIAAELNKAFPWTKGKAKTKKKEAVDPKVGKQGAKVQHGAEMTGPVGELIDFIVGISESLTTLATSTVPALTDSVKAKVQDLAKAATAMATVISAEIVKAFPAATMTGKGKKRKKTGGDALAALLAGSEAAGPMGAVIGLISDTVGVLQTMTEVDPRLFEPPSGAWERVGKIITGMVGSVSGALAGITISDNVLTAADRMRTLADALMSVLDVMKSVSDVDAGNFGTAGWTNLMAAAGGMVNAAETLPGLTSGRSAPAGMGGLAMAGVPSLTSNSTVMAGAPVGNTYVAVYLDSEPIAARVEVRKTEKTRRGKRLR